MRLFIIRLFIILAGFLVLAALPARASHGGHHDILIKVNGLVCDFCARSIENVFHKQNGVKAVDVNLDAHEISVDLADGADIPDDTLRTLVTDAGFAVTEILRP